MIIETEKVKELSNLIFESKKLCVFTGAGISVPSGIPDFRSESGIFAEKLPGNISPEQVLSYRFFINNTKLFYRFYRKKMLYPNAKPNAAHKYFASLESKKRKVTIVTQNIDGLHTMAGSTNVVELHGSVTKNYCISCCRRFDLDFILDSEEIPTCPYDGGIIKPDVVLYGEELSGRVITNAVDAIREADTMVVVGTSLTVYPAASFVNFFKGKALIFINKTPTNFDAKADLVFNGDIIDVIEKLQTFSIV